MPHDSLVLPLGLAVIVCVLVVLWWRARHRVGRANRARQSVARTGEARAEDLLHDHGFRIVGRQVTRRWVLMVDGEPHPVHCRADLLVEARSRSRFPRGARFVAEVKTGSRAPDPTHPATRRQLMEYLQVFDVDGVLLIDMEADRIRHVEFD